MYGNFFANLSIMYYKTVTKQIMKNENKKNKMPHFSVRKTANKRTKCHLSQRYIRHIKMAVIY